MATNTDVQDLSPSAKLLATVDQQWFKVESAFNLLAAFFIFGIMMLGVVQVIGRSFFNQPVRGYVDIVEIAITVFAFLAIAYCQRLAGHVRMEIIIGRFKGRVLWITEVFGTCIALAIVVILMYYGWEHFLRAWNFGDSSIDVEIILWPPKLMVPTAFAMLSFRLILQLIGFLRLCVYPNAVHIAIPELETVEKVAEEEIKAGLAGDTEGVVLPTVDQKEEAGR